MIRKIRTNRRERRGLSRTNRDRAARICAVGAVACLGSFIVHWSRPFPDQRQPWEDDLFGDLVPITASTPATPSSATTGGGENGASDPISPPTPANLEPATPRMMPADPVHQILSPPLEQRPPDQQPRFVRHAAHQQSPDAPLVWLSGEIEISPEDTTPPTNAGSVAGHVPPTGDLEGLVFPGAFGVPPSTDDRDHR